MAELEEYGRNIGRESGEHLRQAVRDPGDSQQPEHKLYVRHEMDVPRVRGEADVAQNPVGNDQFCLPYAFGIDRTSHETAVAGWQGRGDRKLLLAGRSCPAG